MLVSEVRFLPLLFEKGSQILSVIFISLGTGWDHYWFTVEAFDCLPISIILVLGGALFLIASEFLLYHCSGEACSGNWQQVWELIFHLF